MAFMKKYLLPILAFTMVFSLTSCGNNTVENNSATTQYTEQSNVKTELTVWGMTCNRCVNKITNVVSGLDGVINVIVDLKNETVTVEHEHWLDIDVVKKSITDEGYTMP